MVTNWEVVAEVKIDCLHSLLWRSKTDWPIVNQL